MLKFLKLSIDEISNLYLKFGLEKFQNISNVDFQYIYENWLTNLGYDLVVFYSEEEEYDDVIIYDSQSDGNYLN